MVLPIRLIWNLKMDRSQKMSIGGLFCIGWICIIVATIRVAQLGSTASNGTPQPSWLALWAIIEASIGKLLAFWSAVLLLIVLAVIIGSCPGLYRIFKAYFAPSQPSYYPYESFSRRPTASGGVNRGDIPLSRFSGGRRVTSSSSQEKLARDITVTSQFAVTVGDRGSMDRALIYDGR